MNASIHALFKKIRFKVVPQRCEQTRNVLVILSHKLKRLPVRQAVFTLSIQPRLDAYVSRSCSRAHNRVVTVLARLEPIFFFTFYVCSSGSTLTLYPRYVSCNVNFPQQPLFIPFRVKTPLHSIPPVSGGSFAVHFGDHLRSRIICGRFWGSFAVWGSFPVGD